MNIKAIQTEYNGFLFRSRLEARWAVFFDTLHIDYRYEPEGFDLDGTRYLPDFYLPGFETWVEIKPDCPSLEERRKAIELSIASGKHTVILTGDVWLDCTSYGFGNLLGNLDIVSGPDDTCLSEWITSDECVLHHKQYGIMGIDFKREYIWSSAYWYECSKCSKVGLLSASYRACECGRQYIDTRMSDRLKQAFTAARQARFEYGR